MKNVKGFREGLISLWGPPRFHRAFGHCSSPIQPHEKGTAGAGLFHLDTDSICLWSPDSSWLACSFRLFSCKEPRHNFTEAIQTLGHVGASVERRCQR